MQRKLIAQKDSFTVTLPKKWIQENNLSSGAELFIESIDESLLISATKTTRDKTIEIELTPEMTNTLKLVLLTIYRQGYDRAIFRNVSNEQKEHLLKALPLLLGFELVEDLNQKLIFESVTEPSESKDLMILRRLFLLNKEVFSYVIADGKKGELAHRLQVFEIAQKTSQYDNFLKRRLSKAVFPSSSSYYMWALITHLLLFNKSAFHLYEQAIKTISLSNEILDSLEDVGSAFTMLYEGFFSDDMRKTHKGGDLARKTLRGPLLKELHSLKGDSAQFLYYCTEIARITYHMASSTQGIIFSRGFLDVGKINNTITTNK